MSKRERIHNPDIKLARLMNRQLGTNVTPKQVRDFVTDNWSKVQALSHSIHDDQLASQSLAESNFMPSQPAACSNVSTPSVSPKSENTHG